MNRVKLFLWSVAIAIASVFSAYGQDIPQRIPKVILDDSKIMNSKEVSRLYDEETDVYCYLATKGGHTLGISCLPGKDLKVRPNGD